MLERIFSKPIIKVVSRAKLLTIAHGKTLIGIELDGWGWLRISNPSEIKYKFFFFNNYLQLKVTQNQNIALCAFNLFGRTSQEINLDCVFKSYPVLPENVKSEIYAFTVDEQLSVINQNRALLQDKLNSSVIKYESFNGSVKPLEFGLNQRLTSINEIEFNKSFKLEQSSINISNFQFPKPEINIKLKLNQLSTLINNDAS